MTHACRCYESQEAQAGLLGSVRSVGRVPMETIGQKGPVQKPWYAYAWQWGRAQLPSSWLVWCK